MPVQRIHSELPFYCHFQQQAPGHSCESRASTSGNAGFGKEQQSAKYYESKSYCQVDQSVSIFRTEMTWLQSVIGAQ